LAQRYCHNLADYQAAPRSHFCIKCLGAEWKGFAMDTLHFEPQSFHSPRVSRVFGDRTRRIDEVNLSEPEIFMLRGRRLQAQLIAGALRRVLAKLRYFVRRSDDDPPRPQGCRSHA
jgi:hypothetical protein